MPGFVGIVGKHVANFQSGISEALTRTVYSPKSVSRDVYSNTQVILKQSVFNFLSSEPDAVQGKLHAWCDGEIYSKSKLFESGQSFTSTILRHYAANTLPEFLQRVNGIYLAIIYDEERQCVLVITDRYGLKPFYYCVADNSLMLAVELKCFPAFPSFRMEIRRDVVDCFLTLEHMMGTATWFNRVEVTKPATIYTYSIAEDTLKEMHYWSWGQIKPTRVSLAEATEEIGRLLRQAIETRFNRDEKIGVGLSGGFDSRAILAGVVNHKPVTYTFGTENSADVRIARQVAERAGVRNIHMDMHIPRWIQKRFNGVWKVDGMLNMYHMHYSHLMNEIPKFLDTNLSGFLGDGVLGQTYLKKKGKLFLDKRVDKETAEHYYGKYFIFSDPNDSFFDINKVDTYLIYNRGRRLTGLGMEEANKTIYQRLPFMDNELMDFSYSMPDSLRVNNVAYHGALMALFPEFYRDIPHATSGVPINLTPDFMYQSARFFNRIMWIAKFKLGFATSFTDVYNWIKQPNAAKLIRTLLDPKKALYPNFTEMNFLNAYFEPHLAGKGNFMKKTMSALTMEIWLQQIINNNYISDHEA